MCSLLFTSFLRCFELDVGYYECVRNGRNTNNSCFDQFSTFLLNIAQFLDVSVISCNAKLPKTGSEHFSSTVDTDPLH